jgi:hypothetical protein
MDVSQILNPDDRSDESKWLASFINWREDFFADQMRLDKNEKMKFKEKISNQRCDIENGISQSSIGMYRENLHWLVHTMPYPHIETVPFEQKYSIRNIFYLNSKNEHRCLFLEIQDHKSDFKDFFLSLNNMEKTGLLCPICGSSACTVQVVTYLGIPKKKAFLTAQCGNPQCRDVGRKINELDYRKELEKACANEIELSRRQYRKELRKPLGR